MDPAIRNFIDRNGAVYAENGIPRAAGLIVAYLTICDEPQSLETLARELEISKASVSLNTRFAEQCGLIERVPGPGRRMFYRVPPDLWERTFASKEAACVLIARVCEETLRDAEELSVTARERLEDMESLYAFSARELPRFVEAWRADQAQQRAAAGVGPSAEEAAPEDSKPAVCNRAAQDRERGTAL